MKVCSFKLFLQNCITEEWILSILWAQSAEEKSQICNLIVKDLRVILPEG